MGGTLDQGVVILALTFAQGVLATMSSRSRNRSNMTYHALCQGGSHTVWFLALSTLLTAEVIETMLVPYVIGYTSGSLFGAKISMRIERWVGATT